MLIEFMQGKQDKLDSFGIKYPRYFTRRHAAHIRKWKDDEAKQIWDNLSCHVTSSMGILTGLGNEQCPFCWKYRASSRGCSDCTYPINHVNCYDLMSSFKKLNKKMINLNKRLSINFYEDLLKIINKRFRRIHE
jgi:hypothetical protein